MATENTFPGVHVLPETSHKKSHDNSKEVRDARAKGLLIETI